MTEAFGMLALDVKRKRMLLTNNKTCQQQLTDSQTLHQDIWSPTFVHILSSTSMLHLKTKD